jgi:hypothetical protein
MTNTEQRFHKKDWTLAMVYIPGVPPIGLTKKDEFTVADEMLTVKYANVPMPAPQGSTDQHVGDVEMHINLLMVTRVEFYNQKAIIQPPVNKNMIIAP